MVKLSARSLDRLFHALADQTRRKILVTLSRGESTVGELARPHKMSLAAVSKHLGVLETAGLIDRKRVGSFQVVNLRAESLQTANKWLSFYEKCWGQKLNALQDLLEKKK
ncbi:MAG: winged helix-turn-helix transcriptional regulator [Betaproteobacteria bacterium]|nr:winged helix-turn-helix transcriptional regulator [Betaproteobacteria bacterium]